MNTTRLARLAAGFALAIGSAACNSDRLTNLNIDPNNPTDAPPAALFTSAVDAGVGRWLGGFDHGQTDILIQHFAETTYPQEDEYINFSADRTEGSFNGAYTNELEDLRKVIGKGQQLNRPAVYGPAMVLQTWDFDYLTDSWGDVPYSQALQGDTATGSLAPAYDKQQDIYAGFFTTLDAAVTAMANDDPGDPGLGTADPLYHGNVQSWIRFANSLRARLAMRLVNADPSTANAQLTAAFSQAGGTFQSNADAAMLVWPGDGVNDNPLADRLATRDDYRMSKTFMDSLVAWHDPRVAVFAQPVVDSSVYPGGYGGMPNGLSQDSAGKWFRIASRPGVIFYPGVTSYGTYGTSAGLTQPSYLMTYAELMFIRAEAAERGLGGLTPGEAEADYDAGITASMNQWGITDPVAINAYLAQPAIAYKHGTAGQIQIAQQKWIALFRDGAQAWAEWRRTCQPSWIKAGPAAILTYVPRRFLYSIAEQSVNADNVNAAIADQGPDTFGTAVYWDKQPSNAPTYVSAAACAGTPTPP